jgi:predicted short-subunit dehydrogenase-like oxidoreductase (DUF2520 family)
MMKIGFIGAGKVGTALGLYLKRKEYNISGYFSRSLCSAEYSAAMTNTIVFGSKEELVFSSDLIFLTVNDDNIRTVALEIASLSSDLKNKIFVHTSGALNCEELKELYNKGATICSLHPLYPFSNIEKSSREIKNINFTLEGLGNDLAVVEAILKENDIAYTIIKSNDKALYHAAACVSSNYLVTLLHTGIEMLMETGMSQEVALNTLKGLSCQALNNVFDYGSEAALTGPISRYDLETVKTHIAKIRKYNNNWIDIYKTMGRATYKIAQKKKGENSPKLYKILK